MNTLEQLTAKIQETLNPIYSGSRLDGVHPKGASIAPLPNRFNVLYLTRMRTAIEQGLMIGSGVVESSNRRVVTQRLKQAGMHWSKLGAEGIMALRAAYLNHEYAASIFQVELYNL